VIGLPDNVRTCVFDRDSVLTNAVLLVAPVLVHRVDPA
jgi:hypothetical protein